MKTVYIIGNWKSHKTISEAKEWSQQFKEHASTITENTEKKIILCPPFHLLPLVSALIQEYTLPFALGAQDVSPFEVGAHTGEIAATQLAEFVSYVIIGHSERRAMGETDEMISQKAAQSIKAGITPILCVQGKDTPVPEGVAIVAYEPVFAIGTGHADTPEDAQEVLQAFKDKGIQTTIYGGSVTAENVGSFLAQSAVDGVLPGTASLDAHAFLELITHA